MKLSQSSRSSRWGFTLVEIMVVVVIIALLALIAIPGFLKARRHAQNSRFASDVRTFAQAYETYATKFGVWPANAGNSVVPAGMSGELRDSNWTVINSVGGRWNWDYNNMGFTAAISTTGVT